MCTPVRGVVFVIAMMLAAAPAAATVVQVGTLEELVQDSSVVVHARVSLADDGDPAHPFQTVVELELLETLKTPAKSERTLTLILPGGRSGQLASSVAGVPRFSVGDEVVLLLEATPRGELIPAGLGQGVFKVDRSGPVPMARRQPHGATYVDKRGLESSFAAAPERLDELLARLRTLASQAVPR